jgi:cytochrome c-type biogenesis protein CcmH
MKTLKIIIILFLLLTNNHLKADDQIERNKITKNLRCLICQGQSVYDSDSEFANSMKILVDKKLDEGLSENEIYDYFKEKYGEWILYDPSLNKNTYILWLLPILIFLIGGAIVYKKFKFKN